MHDYKSTVLFDNIIYSERQFNIFREAKNKDYHMYKAKEHFMCAIKARKLYKFVMDREKLEHLISMHSVKKKHIHSVVNLKLITDSLQNSARHTKHAHDSTGSPPCEHRQMIVPKMSLCHTMVFLHGPTIVAVYSHSSTDI